MKALLTDQERLTALERSNRRLKAGMLSLIAIGTALASLGAFAPQPKIVTATRFILTDESGRERGELSANEKAATLQLLNADGSRAAVVAAGSKDNGLYLADKHGEIRAGIISSDIEGSIALMNKATPNEAFIVTDNATGTVLAIRDPKGNDRVHLGITARGPAFAVADGHGIQRFAAGEVGAVALNDKGQIYWGSFGENISPEERVRIMNLLNSGFRPPN